MNVIDNPDWIRRINILGTPCVVTRDGQIYRGIHYGSKTIFRRANPITRHGTAKYRQYGFRDPANCTAKRFIHHENIMRYAFEGAPVSVLLGTAWDL